MRHTAIQPRRGDHVLCCVHGDAGVNHWIMPQGRELRYRTPAGVEGVARFLRICAVCFARYTDQTISAIPISTVIVWGSDVPIILAPESVRPS